MTLLWIKNTDGLKSGIQLINQVDKNKFQKLVRHLSDSTIEKNDTGPFTPEELLGLQKILKLNENEVALVIKTVRHILKRLCRFLMSPACILEDLTNTLELEKEKSVIFIETYKQLMKNLSSEFGIKNFGTLEEINEAHWQVNLEMTSSKNLLERCPSVMFQLETNKSQCEDNLVLEFDESELKNFHQQLENIQNEIDNITCQESV